ncbi:MAG: CDP-alcohol phosphatidyltransferase family protein [Candidatus Diapherotrites archaeon]|jgi:archaetidylinositol phosphate synthase|nr:CDP-alcohol phosphatidyltransferase family protein [Candidatus Diapherotrites archaeon]MBT4597235.1 CDP-alcohol phosphatidyltransferase family protein [Candidatus Diapherotrites archaeon]
MISKVRGKIGLLQKVLAWPFIKLKISPNVISVIGLILALIGVYFVSQQNWLLAFVFFLLAPTMDLIDGTVARALKKGSNWGNYFETMIDKIVDFAMLGSFVLIPGLQVAAVLALGFSMLSSYAKPRVALIIIADNHDWPAIGEHADKLIIILIVLLLASFGLNLIEYGLYLIALIAAIGTIQRMGYAKKLIARAEKKGTLLPYIKKKKER